MQTCLLPFRGDRVGFLFSVCKGKQLYSESNRFLGYWSNKFRKYLCNYLFYREISINRESLPDSLPRPLRKEGSENPTQPPRRGSAYAHTRDKGWALYLIVFCKILANLHSPPFGGAGGGCRGGFIPNHKITITKSQKGFSMCKKRVLI